MSKFANTAVILIDPYNDFLHPEGKFAHVLQSNLIAGDTVARLKDLVAAARGAKIPIYYGLHQQYEEGHYDGWKHMGAGFYQGLEPQLSNGDVVVSKHWNSSSFANTDLDYQLKQRDITNVVLAGLISETCFESTARYAYELGYHVTMIKDATAGIDPAAHEAAARLIWPKIAQEVTTVGAWVATLSE
ncbi:Isochorismatase hydrolase [Athelia psychrophila]|uniref:Isochorismatase hydrolase n=1 Tax=Athelia psychrophila TaxID=1759441 RepID=A0A166D6X2_9AGAM|nr:Isochorismatase hydrolase [Fibularhizoctonia sp. CBS 109695]